VESPKFADKSRPPSAADLTAVLGRAKQHWDNLVAQAQRSDPKVHTEWKYYSSKSGWSCVLRDKRHNVLYLIPSEKRFTASFAIGERALEAARQSGLPDEIVQLIEQAPKYPEGRAVRVEVKSAANAAIASTLLDLKMGN
jgi:hypothetical protein